MRFKFFPGSELSPPFLLGSIIDLDRPQHLLAKVVLEDDCVKVAPITSMTQQQIEDLERFASGIPEDEFKRVSIEDIMHYTTRHRAMC